MGGGIRTQLMGGGAGDGPAHPAGGGGVDRVGDRLAGGQFVGDVVGEVAAVAAVEEDGDRLGGELRRVADGVDGDRPGDLGVAVVADGAEETPLVVVGLRDLGVAGHLCFSCSGGTWSPARDAHFALRWH